MKRYPLRTGGYHTIYDVGDRVTVATRCRVTELHLEWQATILARNDSMFPGRYYYRVTGGGEGWYYETSINPPEGV